MTEVAVDIGVIFGENSSSFAQLESKKLHWMRKQQAACSVLQQGIDRMGALSAEAQSLKRPVTTFQRFAASNDDQAIYLLWEAGNKGRTDSASQQRQLVPHSILLGFIRVVRDRRLYLVDGNGRSYVTTPLCILDFFVHPTVQHHGKGLELFNAMLESEGTSAQRCAFDKPSPAFLHFLQKHFGLKEPIWQPTSFAVFPPFFEGIEPEKGTQQDGEQRQRPLTALERHRRSINEKYDGAAPTPSGKNTPRPAQLDQAGPLIHGAAPATVRVPAGPDTPQGRKVQRDYGHQRIW